jgi:anti-sigma regulatory factor (Ser/Thr protein kinase)
VRIARHPVGYVCGVGRYTHEALLYGADDELVAAAVPFLREGLAAGERAVLVCTDHNAALLSDALGDARVDLLPRREVYRRTPGAVAAYVQLMEREVAAGTPGVRLVGEVDFGTGPVEWTEWSRFEAVCNAALDRYPLWSLCMYDTRQLPPQVLGAGELTHPHLRTATCRTRNDRYLPPTDYLRRFAPAPCPVEAHAPVFDVLEPTDLVALRADLLAALTGAGLAEQPANDLLFAAAEVTTNALRHGRPPVRIRLWSTGRQTVCTVTDAGPGFDDPLAGYLPAHGADLSRGGMGLWLARQLCDQVAMERTPEGFIVRLVLLV